MTTRPTISPPTRRRGGGRCAPAPMEPDRGPGPGADPARVAKALGDPVRMRIVDTLRKAAPGGVCVCELTPLFGISQPAVSRHLRVLREAGVIDVERRGPWAHYFVPADSSLETLGRWLTR